MEPFAGSGLLGVEANGVNKVMTDLVGSVQALWLSMGIVSAGVFEYTWQCL